MKELDEIKRVLSWIIFDRDLRNHNLPMPEEVRKKWEKDYWWVEEYLGDFCKESGK